MIQIHVVLIFSCVFVLAVKPDEFLNRLGFGEDADVFDGVADVVPPTAFFWTTPVLVDAVDGDDDGLAAPLFNVAFVPAAEEFCRGWNGKSSCHAVRSRCAM